MYRALVNEYSSAYRHAVLAQEPKALRLRTKAEAGELAAQFEMELLEDPPALRLREFWEYDVLHVGVLFKSAKGLDQGTRELSR